MELDGSRLQVGSLNEDEDEDDQYDINRGTDSIDGKTFLTEIDSKQHVYQDNKKRSSTLRVPTQVLVPVIKGVEDENVPFESLCSTSVPIPSTVDVKRVMGAATNSIDFSKSKHGSAEKTWNEFWYSHASIEILDDTFWWMLTHFFKDNHTFTNHQDLILDRISTNFVHLIFCLPHQCKDFFFDQYYDALAQCIYHCFYALYPRTRDKMGEAFKKEIKEILCVWTVGHVLGRVQTSHWNIVDALPKEMKKVYAHRKSGHKKPQKRIVKGEATARLRQKLNMTPSSPEKKKVTIQEDKKIVVRRNPTHVPTKASREPTDMKHSSLVSRFLQQNDLTSSTHLVSLKIPLTDTCKTVECQLDRRLDVLFQVNNEARKANRKLHEELHSMKEECKKKINFHRKVLQHAMYRFRREEADCRKAVDADCKEGTRQRAMMIPAMNECSNSNSMTNTSGGSNAWKMGNSSTGVDSRANKLQLMDPAAAAAYTLEERLFA